jgi:hypothetical protein
VWENPQIVEAIAAGVGIAGPDELKMGVKGWSQGDALSAQLFG